MEKKRLVGIVIIGILAIILGVSGLLFSPFLVIEFIHLLKARPACSFYLLIANIFILIISPLMLVAGIGILRTRDWGRKLLLFLVVINLLLGEIAYYLARTEQIALYKNQHLVHLIQFSVQVFIIYYLMRPKVKNIFR